ncbi:MAG: right-handed parallel beta-helix repeat-containing protein [Planctomycetota bacterium]|nr:right-handed parallel beta-helix repeat-containing protein [Planctomycetota bacterium]
MATEPLNHPTRSDADRRFLLLCSLSLTLWLCVTGCVGDRAEDPSETDTIPPDTVVSLPIQITDPSTVHGDGHDRPPLFEGANSAIAGDGQVLVAWDPAQDDLTSAAKMRYHIYLSGRPGKQDFSEPTVTTDAGADSHLLEGLANGEQVFLVVRAIDEKQQSDSNEAEWPALPNPVLYVDASAPAGGDGASPTSALQHIDDAIGEAIGLLGINILVAEGEYEEQLLLFEGMAIYGGFPTGFSGDSSPDLHRSLLIGSPRQDSVILPPGDQLVVVDGFHFDGKSEARRAIVADDCHLRLSRCEVLHYKDKGIQIETDLDKDGLATGTILSCIVSGNGGDGIRIEGHVDLAIRNCLLVDNQQSGLSVLPLLPRSGAKARIDMDRCEVARNQDIGINIKIDSPLGDGDAPARIRIGLRGVLVERNHDHGASFDIRYPEGSHADLRIRVEQCSFISNHKTGLHIDADAPGDFSVLESEFLGNLGSAGVLASGDSTDAVTRLHSCFLAAQAGCGVLLSGQGLLDVTRSLFVDNSGAAVKSSDLLQLKARMWACSGVGPAPVGVRSDGVELAEPNSARPKMLRIDQVTGPLLSISSPDAAPLGTGFLHHHRGDPPIAIEGQEPDGTLMVSGGNSSKIEAGSCWLWSLTPQIPTWPQYLDWFAAGWSSTLCAPIGDLRPGVDRSIKKSKRSISFTAVEPMPGTLSPGPSPRWLILLSEELPKAPKVTLIIDGKTSPVETDLDGKRMEISSSALLSAGQRVRIEWTPDVSPAPSDPDHFSLEWSVASEGDR